MRLVGSSPSDGGASRRNSEIDRQASLIRAEIGTKRSDTMLRLFDYLLACSGDDRAPKEIEVFHAVFAKPGRESSLYDSAVRSYIHRLRQKMDVFYGDRCGPRLVIPKGEYRIFLTDVDGTHGEHGQGLPRPRWLSNVRRWRPRILGGVGAIGLLVLTIMSWMVINGFGGARAAASETFLWQQFRHDVRPTVMVIGDYYLIGKSVDGRQVTHLLRDFSINSRDDLDLHLMRYPADMARYVDVNLSYFPTSTASALDSVMPTVKALDAHKPRPSSTIALTRLGSETLKQSNIVYLGLLSGLGILRDPLFDASGFVIESSYEELVDRRSGRIYRASRDIFDNAHSPQIDFAYLASMPGPAGNRILIVAGTRDAAAAAMARLVVDPAQIDALLNWNAKNPNFEALYQVHSIGGTIMDTTLITARPLKVQGIWDGTMTGRQFPDSTPTTGSLEEPREQ